MKQSIHKGKNSALYELSTLLTKHRQLSWEMTKREISDRYAGQVFGIFWAFGHPLIQMAVYVFIFGIVFKVKLGGSVNFPMDYTTYLLRGLIPWLAFVESMSKGATAIYDNASLVKQVVFPIEILPIKGCLASMLTLTVFQTALLIYILVTHHSLPLTYLLLPVLMALQLLAMMGISFVLSAIGAYFKDIKDMVQVFCITGMYVMPVFYLPDMVPRIFLPVIYANPFSYMIWCYQDAIYFGRFAHPLAWAIFPVLSILTFYLGFLSFRKLKSIFGNIL